MFRQRLLTFLVLVPLVLLAIYYANMWAFGSVVLLFVVVGGWEWTQLVPINSLMSKFLFILALLLVVGYSMHELHYWLICGLVLWVLNLLAVLTFPASQTFWGHRVLVGGSCLLLLPLFANSMIAIFQHTQGRQLITYILCLVWATDTGAYLAGKYWGCNKLIPRVSPGKTVEGTLGGFLLAMLVAIIGYYYFKPHSAVIWYAVAVGTALISMLGDLFISMLKRRSKLKDTGHLFPGHGGVLDRIDSLIAALPLFYYGLPFVVIGQV